MVDLLGKPVAYRAPRGAVGRWAAKYGYGERQIKNWISLGRRVGEVPPFDDPEKMRDWLERHHGRVSGRFLAAVGGEGSEPTRPETPHAPTQLPEAHAGEGSLELQIAGYQREWAFLGKLRETALLAGDFSRASALLTQQQSISAELRQLERLLPTVLEQRGEFQRISDVRSSVMEFLTVLKSSLIGRAPAASSRLRAATSDAELQAAWRSEINAVFAGCCSARFADPLVLS